MSKLAETIEKLHDLYPTLSSFWDDLALLVESEDMQHIDSKGLGYLIQDLNPGITQDEYMSKAVDVTIAMFESKLFDSKFTARGLQYDKYDEIPEDVQFSELSSILVVKPEV